MSEFFNHRPDGFSSNLRVVTCFMEHKENILILQRSVGPIAPLKWGIPGGKVEEDERNFEALKREIYEELSLKVNDHEKITHIKNIFVRHTLTDYELVLYRWILDEQPTVKLNPKEHVNFVWIPIFEIINLDLLEGQLEAFKLVYDNDYSFVRDHAS